MLTLYSALTTVSVTVLGDVRQFFSICNLGYTMFFMWSGICVPNFRLSLNLSPWYFNLPRLFLWMCPLDVALLCVPTDEQMLRLGVIFTHQSSWNLPSVFLVYWESYMNNLIQLQMNGSLNLRKPAFHIYPCQGCTLGSFAGECVP